MEKVRDEKEYRVNSNSYIIMKNYNFSKSLGNYLLGVYEECAWKLVETFKTIKDAENYLKSLEQK